VGSSATLRQARNDVTSWLHGHGIDAEMQDRAALVVSELATNAVQAAPGAEYNVHGTLYTDGEVVVTVVSCTTFEQPPPREHWGPPSTYSESGRGLMIVDDLSANVQVDCAVTGRVVVTASLRSPEAGDADEAGGEPAVSDRSMAAVRRSGAER
jgi:anti-sigma regulatory factor (Ser/Thr protein kinase)